MLTGNWTVRPAMASLWAPLALVTLFADAAWSISASISHNLFHGRPAKTVEVTHYSPLFLDAVGSAPPPVTDRSTTADEVDPLSYSSSMTFATASSRRFHITSYFIAGVPWSTRTCRLTCPPGVGRRPPLPSAPLSS